MTPSKFKGVTLDLHLYNWDPQTGAPPPILNRAAILILSEDIFVAVGRCKESTVLYLHWVQIKKNSVAVNQYKAGVSETSEVQFIFSTTWYRIWFLGGMEDGKIKQSWDGVLCTYAHYYLLVARSIAQHNSVDDIILSSVFQLGVRGLILEASACNLGSLGQSADNNCLCAEFFATSFQKSCKIP